MWYKDWFDSGAYELVYHDRGLVDAAPLIDLIEAEAAPPHDGRILDVACGRGRHARLLAARGYRVTGIDFSAKAIETALRRAREEDVSVDFHEGDMRALPFNRCFDGVLNLFTSFGYFYDDFENEVAIEEMRRALVPGGFLFQDFLNADYVAETLVPEDERVIDSEELGEVIVRQKRWVRGINGGRRLEKRIELHCLHHADGEPDRYSYTESVRLFTLADFERMYDQAGLRLEKTFGHYDGRPHGPDTPRLILLARRDA
jgi:SAM-dependent methyltransferase